MPTYGRSESFKRDYKKRLDDTQRTKAKEAIGQFVDDLRRIENGKASDFRPSLRVKPMQNHPGIWEMTWEPADGRATFRYGEPIVDGKRHIEWRRIGSHDIFENP